MKYGFLSNLSLDELESLRICLNSEDNSVNELLEEIEKNITYRRRIECGIIDFSSDRMPNYRQENESRCIEFLEELTLSDVPFLRGSFSAREVNRMGSLLSTKVGDNLTDSNFALITLEKFFEEPYNIFCHEGVYNTLNYVKNQIYYYLLSTSNLDKKELFEGMEDKAELAKKQLADIASYIYEIKKLFPQLKVSMGNAGIAATRKRTDVNGPLSSYQRRLVQAVAFGTTYDKLENKDYEDCKRLLFVPRSKERKYR